MSEEYLVLNGVCIASSSRRGTQCLCVGCVVAIFQDEDGSIFAQTVVWRGEKNAFDGSKEGGRKHYRRLVSFE